ncbi:MAG: hypothetical protein MUP09_05595, partial [Thiovulaceae bacterium]|nr:hypothetical protein [Sulfurimonadaceae bacterium]
MKLFHLLFTFFIALFIGGCVQKGEVRPLITPVEELKIAMILPYKLIGRYSYSTSTAVFAYVLTRDRPFMLKSFQVADESPEEMARVLKEIKEQKFHNVIAPLTLNGARI